MRRPIPAAVSAGATSPRRAAPVAVSIAVGAGAVISGLAVAIVVMMRLFGPHGSTLFPPHPAAVMVSEVPEQPVPQSAAVPGDSLAAPPTASPAPEPVMPSVSEPPPPAPGPGTHPLHAGSRKPSDRSADGALAADPTVVVPVERIHTETQSAGESAPTPPPASTTAPAAGGEPAILCGQVIDPDRHPIVRAQVMMADVRVVALTDRSGRFCLTAPAGQRTLSVMALGFTSSRRVVTMGKRTAELTITLRAVAPFPTAH